MHILLIHQAFAALDEAGGTRHYELAHFLIKKGHQVTIITSPVSYLTGKNQVKVVYWSTKESPIPGMTILRTYTYPALHRSFIHRIFSFVSFMISSFLVGLRVKKVDLVWGTTPPIFQSATAWLLARLKRVPFLLEVRDLWPAFAVAVGVLRNSLLIKASLWLESFLYSHADRVIVNSPGFIEHVTQKGAKNVELVTNSVDPAMFSAESDGETLRQDLNLTDKFIVLYAGAFGLSNDLGVLIQAANQLKNVPEIVFLWVGDGKEKSNLQKQSAELGLDNIIFYPPVPKNQMGNVLAASNICVAILKPLELYKTTYPNKVFDYMAAARPVVLAIDGVIRKVVEDANAGLAVPPGNPEAMASAILSMYKSPEHTRQMGLSGREYVKKNFNRIDTANQLESLLLELRRSHA